MPDLELDQSTMLYFVYDISKISGSFRDTTNPILGLDYYPCRSFHAVGKMILIIFTKQVGSRSRICGGRIWFNGTRVAEPLPYTTQNLGGSK